uniref:Uncharacterized protein YjbI, contains pentapeptide repeats n=1 Tax=Candidatus Kentrum sp. DK TaxID=2126562 RepID=A0A450RZC3_9GAMM|nr:MAG: Uncharacterized protein YjbI, contains pentapeptide repeats [Candidatus Kentron sp. DK]
MVTNHDSPNEKHACAPMSNNTNPETSENALTQLLESVNRSAEHLQRVYLEFTLVWTYYILVIGTTTHLNLLLEKTQSLPFLNVNLSMSVHIAYALGPPLFLMLHAYLLAQHRLTAPQLHALRKWRRNHASETYRFRGLMVLPSPFAHLVLESAVSRYANSLLTGLALFIMPVFLFSWLIVSFLPYHSRSETSFHLFLLAIDIFLLGIYWPLIASPHGYHETYRNQGRKEFLVCRLQFVWSWGNGRLLLAGASVIFLFSMCLFTPNPLGNGIWDQIVEWFPLRIEELATPFVSADSSDATAMPRYDLSERDLRHAYLFGMDLRGANLRGADLRHADLRSVDLTGAILDGVWLDHARLGKAKLDKASLKSDETDPEHIKYATLNGANLQEVSAIGAFFRHARLTGAFLGQGDLRGADLSGTGFQGANLADANLRGTILDKADLVGANLTSAHLQGASLQGANLTVANLRGAHLNGAGLFGADLRGANLSGANLQGADLRGGRIAGASFDGARIDQADFRGLRPEPLESGRCTTLRESLEAIEHKTKPDWRISIQHAIRRLGTCQGEMVSFDISGLRREQPPLCDPDTGMAGCLGEPVEKYHQRLITEILIPLACADRSAGIAQRLLSRVATGDFHLLNQRRLACGLIGKGCAARDTLWTSNQVKRQIAGILFGPEDALDFLGDRLQDLRVPVVCLSNRHLTVPE